MNVPSSHFRPLIQRLFVGAWHIHEDLVEKTISFRVGGVGFTEGGRGVLTITEVDTLIPLKIGTGSNDLVVSASSDGILHVTIKNVTKFTMPPETTVNQRHLYPFRELRYGQHLVEVLIKMTRANTTVMKDAWAEEFPDGIGSIQLSWRASGVDTGLSITERFSNWRRFGSNCTVGIYSERDPQTSTDGFLRLTLTLTGVNFSPATTP